MATICVNMSLQYFTTYKMQKCSLTFITAVANNILPPHIPGVIITVGIAYDDPTYITKGRIKPSILTFQHSLDHGT